MRLAGTKALNALKTPPKNIVAVLLMAEDHSLAQQYREELANSISLDLKEKPEIIKLTSDDILSDKTKVLSLLEAQSLFGADTLIYLTLQDEKTSRYVLASLNDYAADAYKLPRLLICAPVLKKSSKLRQTFESQAELCVLHFYNEDMADFQNWCRSALKENGALLEEDVIKYLLQELPMNRSLARAELDKVIAYNHSGQNKLDMETIDTILGDNEQTGLKTCSEIILTANLRLLDKALDEFSLSGGNMVALIRSLKRYGIDLLEAYSLVENGINPEAVAQHLARRKFGKDAQTFQVIFNGWSKTQIMKLLGKLDKLETQCKMSHLPDHALINKATHVLK